MAIAGDRVAVSVKVDVPADVAFEVFTTEIDLWWRRSIAYRVGGRGPSTLHLEPKLGGRVFEEYTGKQGAALHVSGKITAWEPPRHLAFEWRGSNFKPGEVTFVDITFTQLESGATLVELVHRGFAALPPDHPVRHGEPPPEFIRRMGLWWGDLLKSLRDHVASRACDHGD